MAITSKFLRDIEAEARPIIERQMNDAKIIAGLRDVVAAAGGDWGALKALIKARVEDDNDETGEGKRVRKVREKADCIVAYDDMLGSNMNEKNFSEAASYAEEKGVDRQARAKQRTSEAMDDNKAFSKELLDAGLITPEAHAENIAISDGVARKYGAGVIDPETGEITEQPETATNPVLMQEPHVEADRDSGVMHEHGREEGSHPRLPSDPVENKAVGPSVIAADNSPSPETPQAIADDEAAQANPIVVGALSNPQPSSSLGADKAEASISSPSASANPFNNPRCQHPDTCTFAHSRNSCWDCTMAWATRPRDEQVKLWQDALAASETEAV